MKNKNVFAVIPGYNEERMIGEVIRKTKRYIKDIIVVDDGSKDKTYDIADGSGAVALRHVVNLGKGAALKTGCDYAISKGAKVIIAIDADGQHKPEDIPRFLKEINDNDIVFGYRSLDKNMPFILRYGNWFISTCVRILYGISLKDTQSGYRCFTREAYRKIRWDAQDYSMESEMIARAGKHDLRYSQIPIETIYNEKYKGTTVIDGIKIVLNMIWWRLTK